MRFRGSPSSHEYFEFEILNEVQGGDQCSQRSLATRLGIALGLANLLVRKLVRQGWIRVVRVRPNRVRYLLTPAGLAEKARMSRLLLEDSVRSYVAARDRVRKSLAELTEVWPVPQGAGPSFQKRIIFFGTGEIAEIAYICLQETDLTLVGVIGDGPGRFFSLPVRPASDVRNGSVRDLPFDRVVVTSSLTPDATRLILDGMGISADVVHWI